MNDQHSILIVDDEEPIRRLLIAHLNQTYGCAEAASADEAVALLATHRFNLVLSDITMPGMSGLELCEFINNYSTDMDTLVVLASEPGDIQSAIEAMRHGAFDYVVKPFELAQVSLTVARAFNHQSLLSFKRNYEHLLDETVQVRTKELRLANDNLNDIVDILYANYRATLRSLARALEAKDVETKGHSERVVAYCLSLGRELGLSQRDLIALEQGALLHDIGKIGVRDSILLKPGPLTDEQWIEMRAHIDRGLAIIEGIDFLSGARSVVGQHHEKFDGTGYPNGLSGDIIHLHARIFAVADAFDALTSDRPYRAACSYKDACQEITACSGTHFDPKVVRAFLNISEAHLSELRQAVLAHSYPEHSIEEDELRSFIISLKHSGKLKSHISP